MVDGRQYHMNANRDRLLQNALKQVAAEQQRNPEVSSRDYRDPRFANRPMQPAPVPQEPYAGWLGDLVGAIKDIRVPEGPKIPGARTPLNPGGTLGGGVNMLKDMLISSGEDFGAQGTQKNTPIPMGGIAAAGLLPFKSLTKIARSLRGADDAAKAASRTRGMQDADDVIASRARAKQAATDYSPLPSKKPGAGLPKTVDDIFGDVTPSTSSFKKYMTEDGSVFVQKADGTLTDGDTVFNSLDDLLDKTGGNIRRHTDAVKNPLDVEPQWANDLDLEPQWGDNLASAEPVAQTSKGTPGLERENILGPDGRPRIKMSESTGHLVSDRPLLGVGPNRAPVTPKTDAAGRQIQGIFSGMSDAMGGGALADALGPASRGVSKSSGGLRKAAEIPPNAPAVRELTKKAAGTKYITEDGYVFVQRADGTLTDGDMVFDSFPEGEIKLYEGPRLDDLAAQAKATAKSNRQIANQYPSLDEGTAVSLDRLNNDAWLQSGTVSDHKSIADAMEKLGWKFSKKGDYYWFMGEPVSIGDVKEVLAKNITGPRFQG